MARRVILGYPLLTGKVIRLLGYTGHVDYSVRRDPNNPERAILYWYRDGIIPPTVEMIQNVIDGGELFEGPYIGMSLTHAEEQYSKDMWQARLNG